MIFAHTLNQVLCGYKSQTRRIVKPNEKLLLEGNICRVVSGNRTVYQVGKTYAVQPGRGKKSVARILITNIRREQVGFINQNDAIAEGFNSRDEFFVVWKTIHGENSLVSCEVWVLEFEISEDGFRGSYGNRDDRSFNNSDDISSPITRVQRVSMYGGDYETGRMGSFIPDRLPLSP